MASHLYDDRMRPRRHQALQAGACYFMAILSLQWFLGPIRDYAVRSGADPLLAILSQAVVTLLVLVWVAGWVIEVFDVPNRLGPRAAVGFCAVGLIVACDFLAGYLMFGMPPWALAGHFLELEGGVVGLSLLTAAGLPLLRAWREDL